MTTVVEATDLFVAALHGRHAPPNTIKAYASDLRRFAGAVPPDLVALDAAAIRAFLDGNAASAATRRRRYAALCSFYRWLVRQDILDVNPMERVDRVATVSRLPRPLDTDTVARLLAAIPPAATRDRALFTLLYETGMRVGEALGPHNARHVVLALSGLGALQSMDDGTSWVFMMNPGLGVIVTFTELVRDPVHPNVVYEQERGGKLYRSTDGAGHWQVQSSLASQLHSSVNSLVDDGKALYVTASVGILVSHNNGVTWRVLYPGPKAPGGLLGSVRIGSTWVSAFVSQQPQSFPDGLYTPGGLGRWRQVAATDTPTQIIQGQLDVQGMASAMDTRLWAVGPTIFTAAELGGLYRIG